jgi:hypothetical protein
MQDRIHFARDEDVVRDIMLVEREIFVSQQVSDIVTIARDEVIQANDLMPFRKKAVA